MTTSPGLPYYLLIRLLSLRKLITILAKNALLLTTFANLIRRARDLGPGVKAPTAAGDENLSARPNSRPCTPDDQTNITNLTRNHPAPLKKYGARTVVPI